MILRDYQEEMIVETRALLRKHRCVLMQLPTGGGKTAMASFMTGSARAKGLRAWFLCHRDFLLQQTSLTYDEFNIPHGFIAAGHPFNTDNRIQIASVQTLARRLGKLTPPDLIIWDECHHIAAASWEAIFRWAPRTKHVGLTATPIRLDGRGLDAHFEAMVHGPSVAYLIEQGYLSDYRAFAPSKPDLTKVKTVAGDYNKGQLGDALDRSQIIGNMVHHYQDKAAGLRGIYFCVSVEHSQHVAASFNAAGIRALHLDASSSFIERINAARAFARGELQLLTNVDLFGEGYDLAAQAGMKVTIDCVGLARPTQSLGLHLQQIGRVQRPKDYKAVILDHAGNIAKHGLPDEDREWTLQGTPKRKGGDGGPPVRECKMCFAAYPASKLACPECGHVPEIEARGVEEVAGDLKEIEAAKLRLSRNKEEWGAQSIEDMIAIAKRRGYRNPQAWAAMTWTRKERARKNRVKAQAQAHLFEGR
jgi:DNA repair protein RadD